MPHVLYLSGGAADRCACVCVCVCVCVLYLSIGNRHTSLAHAARCTAEPRDVAPSTDQLRPGPQAQRPLSAPRQRRESLGALPAAAAPGAAAVRSRGALAWAGIGADESTAAAGVPERVAVMLASRRGDSRSAGGATTGGDGSGPSTGAPTKSRAATRSSGGYAGLAAAAAARADAVARVDVSAGRVSPPRQRQSLEQRPAWDAHPPPPPRHQQPRSVGDVRDAGAAAGLGGRDSGVSPPRRESHSPDRNAWGKILRGGFMRPQCHGNGGGGGAAAVYAAARPCHAFLTADKSRVSLPVQRGCRCVCVCVCVCVRMGWGGEEGCTCMPIAACPSLFNA